jgi:hypothetical protein
MGLLSGKKDYPNQGSLLNPENTGPYKLLSNLYQRTAAKYPAINDMNIGYKVSPGKSGSFLETWPVGEPGTYGYRRPADLPINKTSVEVFNNNTTPSDLMGDLVSHDLVNTDPNLKASYQQFNQSLQPWQKDRLQEQYKYAVNNGEQRPYEAWEGIAGLPAYYRGNLFDQWKGQGGKTVTTEMYTPEQLKNFERIKKYLKN